MLRLPLVRTLATAAAAPPTSLLLISQPSRPSLRLAQRRLFATNSLRQTSLAPRQQPPPARLTTTTATTTLTRRLMSSTTPTPPRQPQGFYARWTAARPEPPRLSAAWWLLWTVRFVVFGVTGSSSVYFVRPLLKDTLGLEGSMIHGPWQYQLASLVFVTPVYTVILLLVATLAGEQAYFMKVAARMWGRFIPALRQKKQAQN